MKYIKKIIKNVLKKELPKPLGRWKIESDITQINNKIDLSNEDHCGPCGQYALEKIQCIKNKTNLTNLTNIKLDIKSNNTGIY